MRCSRQRTNRNLFSALLVPAAFSPVDAKSSVFLFQYVAVFNDTGCRGKPGMTKELCFLKKFIHYSIPLRG